MGNNDDDMDEIYDDFGGQERSVNQLTIDEVCDICQL